jgi:hypothetical protein
VDDASTGQGGFWEENRNLATGVILASAVAAGVIAFMLRRAREEETMEVPAGVAGRAWERARDVAGEDRVDAAREFFMDRVMPELKPALLAILDDLEEAVDDYFRRTEKAIKRM